VAAGAGSPNRLEPGSFKQANKTHETVARRIRINRIGFQNFSALGARVRYGRG